MDNIISLFQLIKLVNNDQNVTNNIDNNISYNNGEEEWKVKYNILQLNNLAINYRRKVLIPRFGL